MTSPATDPAKGGAAPPKDWFADVLGMFVNEEPHRLPTLAELGPPTQPAPGTRPTPPHITGDGFRALVKASQQAHAEAKEDLAHEEVLERTRRIKQMLQQHLDDQFWHSLIEHARAAAGKGALEFQLLRFPAGLCADEGRKIDVAEAGWEETLRGEPAELYARWKRELKPTGFGLSARILDYPHGRLGDIGLFLTWGGPTA